MAIIAQAFLNPPIGKIGREARRLPFADPVISIPLVSVHAHAALAVDMGGRRWTAVTSELIDCGREEGLLGGAAVVAGESEVRK